MADRGSQRFSLSALAACCVRAGEVNPRSEEAVRGGGREGVKLWQGREPGRYQWARGRGRMVLIVLSTGIEMGDWTGPMAARTSGLGGCARASDDGGVNSSEIAKNCRAKRRKRTHMHAAPALPCDEKSRIFPAILHADAPCVRLQACRAPLCSCAFRPRLVSNRRPGSL